MTTALTAITNARIYTIDAGFTCYRNGTIVLMTVTSISDGLALGLLVYIAAILLSGRSKEISKMSWVLGVCLPAYYALAGS